jgi:hypothetical protein
VLLLFCHRRHRRRHHHHHHLWGKTLVTYNFCLLKIHWL